MSDEANVLVRREGTTMTVLRSRSVRVDTPDGRSVFVSVPVGLDDQDACRYIASEIARRDSSLGPLEITVVASSADRLHITVDDMTRADGEV